jgi:hypothetical protein
VPPGQVTAHDDAWFDALFHEHATAIHRYFLRRLPMSSGARVDDAEDIAAVLRYRIDNLASTPPRGCQLRPRLIAGLIPEPLGPMSAEDRQAIDERKELIESRARAIAEDAVVAREAWTRRLRAPHVGQGLDEAWLDAAVTVAAYRDRYKVTSDLPVGGGARNEAQRAGRRRAQVALREALAVSGADRQVLGAEANSRTVSVPQV